ncbi:phosphate ABC transporter permease subunit PstC [Pseudobacteriovorax antillogorgiicola]|uniref:Phosphate transport system permease protein n=1 Tax=Pseudobacteriovorax antillogorgiicola TaxID=1513793 RepID=A0A1Y6CPA9_9BACT|nr:phosphate ABC transporter permease subunit PstC [Pseudobacteriovorax antillogorgiicola]TCS44409.1 phosphate ABC transporter membrane protein 1 (PhoT family) [Pseudobacteriovorax antillogorgiicola]SMF79205.1 phosphate ABC transporter membrane protein 1, PhoT family [Pseudobacteriovorax antillogorgiicola]
MSSQLWVKNRPLQKFREGLVTKALLGCALVSIVTTIGINAVLLLESFHFFEEISISEFLFTTRWAPLFEPRSFGVLPLISGTLLVAVGSLMVALPLGLGIAIYLSEYASSRSRSILKPMLEVLAGVPSVVYGYFALTTVTPWLRSMFPGVEVFNAASAAIVVGIMILPTIASICDDSLAAVPKALREGAFALGARKFEVVTQVVTPAALSGILASFILGFSRAIGETMAVTLAAGATPQVTVNPFVGIQTMTAYIAQVSLGDTPHGSIEYQSIFAVGLLLFLMTLMMNLVSQYIVKTFARRYE